jgi:hypothetical protein
VLVTDSTPWSGVNTHDAGWCVPWESFGASLATALAETPVQLAQRGTRAREWVLNDFSWDKSARTLLDFYASLRSKPAR